MGILMVILMGSLLMDSMGWPYDSSDCLLFTTLREAPIKKIAMMNLKVYAPSTLPPGCVGSPARLRPPGLGLPHRAGRPLQAQRAGSRGRRLW